MSPRESPYKIVGETQLFPLYPIVIIHKGASVGFPPSDKQESRQMTFSMLTFNSKILKLTGKRKSFQLIPILILHMYMQYEIP
jgi:hypothetical protein